MIVFTKDEITVVRDFVYITLNIIFWIQQIPYVSHLPDTNVIVTQAQYNPTLSNIGKLAAPVN